MRSLGNLVPITLALATPGCSLDLPPPSSGGADSGASCGPGTEIAWPDPLGYTKPLGVALQLPDEASCPNKWYVDLSAGSGKACTEQSPCASLEDVVGLPGTAGGPAYVYVRGDGLLRLYEVTFHGSAGSEVVIKPWPGSGLVSLRASDDAENLFASDGIHHVVVDGGPNLDFEFVATQGAAENMNAFELENADQITYYRCRFRGDASISALVTVSAYGEVDEVRFINCYFANAPSANALHFGNVDSSARDVLVQSCVFHDIGQAAVWLNPRVLIDGVTIEGSAFHGVGKESCPACAQAIRVAPEGGEVGKVLVRNNLFWDLGAGAVAAEDGTTTVVHNTVFDYGKGMGNGEPFGIVGGGAATIENNIVYAPSGVAPLSASPSFVTTKNMCKTGCDVAWAEGSFVSSDPASPDFLKLAPSSPAVDVGADAGVTVDYFGACRPRGAGFDLGAAEAP